MEEGKTSLPQKSLIAMLICFGVVIVFVFAVIYPQSRTLTQQDERISTLTPKLEEHEALLPFYENLQKKLDPNGAHGSGMARETKKTCDDIYEIQTSFEAYAKTSRVRLVNLKQDINSISSGTDLVKMDLYAQGDFFKFREFLLNVCELPCLDHMAAMGIQTIRNSDDLELHMRLCFKTK